MNRFPISASSGEMKKRYGLIYVDRDNQGKGSFRREPIQSGSNLEKKKSTISFQQDLEVTSLTDHWVILMDLWNIWKSITLLGDCMLKMLWMQVLLLVQN